MIAYVIADTDEKDLVFHVVCPVKGMSVVYREKGKAESISGNPYLVYGARVEEFTGWNKFNLSIIVAHVRSGKIS